MNSKTDEARLGKIRDRIQKLLALAEGSNYEAESETAQERAEKLMAEYGITLAEVLSKSADRRLVIVEEKIRYDGTYGTEIRDGGALVMTELKWSLPLVSRGYGPARYLWLIGEANEVEMQIRILQWLQPQAIQAMRNHRAGLRHQLDRQALYHACRSFIDGWYGTVSVRLRRLYQESSGTDLVLTGRVDKIQSEYEALGNSIGEPKPKRAKTQDELSYADGLRAGLDADISSGHITEGV